MELTFDWKDSVRAALNGEADAIEFIYNKTSYVCEREMKRFTILENQYESVLISSYQKLFDSLRRGMDCGFLPHILRSACIDSCCTAIDTSGTQVSDQNGDSEDFYTSAKKVLLESMTGKQQAALFISNDGGSVSDIAETLHISREEAAETLDAGKRQFVLNSEKARSAGKQILIGTPAAILGWLLAGIDSSPASVIPSVACKVVVTGVLKETIAGGASAAAGSATAGSSGASAAAGGASAGSGSAVAGSGGASAASGGSAGSGGASAAGGSASAGSGGASAAAGSGASAGSGGASAAAGSASAGSGGVSAAGGARAAAGGAAGTAKAAAAHAGVTAIIGTVGGKIAVGAAIGVIAAASITGGVVYHNQAVKNEQKAPAAEKVAVEKIVATTTPAATPTAEPTAKPTAEPTETPTPTPTATPTPTPEPVDTTLQDALNAYAAYLNTVSDSKFSLGYIDEDDVPELFIVPQVDVHVGAVDILSYVNGSVVDLGYHGSYCTISYQDHGNLVESAHSGSGSSATFFVSFDIANGTSTNVMEFDENFNAMTGGNDTKINGAAVSQEEYDSTLNSYSALMNQSVSTPTAYDITPENIQSVLASYSG